MNRRALLPLLFLCTGCAGGSRGTAPPPAPATAQGPAPSPPPPTPQPAARESTSGDRPQYPSTYTRHPYPPVLISNATIMTATGLELPHASILITNGRIVAVGSDIGGVPPDVVRVDGTGRYVTPGIIDVHSHLGVYAAPNTDAESDGNESTGPVMAEVWAEHSFWPQDPQIPLAIAGGVTVIEALPGSADLIGGRSAVLKLVPARTVQAMKFPGARYDLKMACGENPKRVYGRRGQFPSTRMGNMAGYRGAFIQAETYRRRWDKWNQDPKGDPPERNLRLETLAEVLRGDMYALVHCYRADDMAQMLDLAREFGFKFRAFHHAVEAYKIPDLLAAAGTGAVVWSDWYGFKEEAMDGIEQNAALLEQGHVRVALHSDDPGVIQRLNQEAAKAMFAGQRAGIPITRDQALRWITANAAWMIGLDSIVGTLEPGKMADVVVWSGDPFSVYTKAVQVYNDGWLVYDRTDPAHQPRSDFELGQEAPPGNDR
ncbi:MAG TPA: amidohydrolase [Gemmatimonadales bacterium]|nr:amidohydrolase [Gemmatimonadales bacterium]